MPGLAAFTSPIAWHILSYGTVLGTSVFNTFFQGIVAFKVLPRPSFSVLQQKLFPYYFALQTGLPVASLLSFPTSSLSNLTAGDNLWQVTMPLTLSALLGATNWLVLGPWTTSVIKQRKHQETRDGKKYYDDGPKSAEMQKLNKTFAALHGVSSLVNLVDIFVMVYYGFVLAGRVTIAT
ncbi:uncharacterized protein PV09_02678 [Verruconis gallopava]|uniref:TMEM205-like domain-containing protein n=1 Tax=Verruconis gallopava TaxID=253628 RepID=A0A0D2AHY3_9PEZI|nr:uncharacterized protein PV09_02678 [Verruconis gallopava]KIW06200.1 hypothetical protein PV09_02678 [Verruconis gallopava]